MKDPALLASAFAIGGQSRSEALIVYALVIGFIVWIVSMPLDVKRFHWTSPLPPVLNMTGGALLVAAWVFMVRSFTDNPFVPGYDEYRRRIRYRLVPFIW